MRATLAIRALGFKEGWAVLQPALAGLYGVPPALAGGMVPSFVCFISRLQPGFSRLALALATQGTDQGLKPRSRSPAKAGSKDLRLTTNHQLKLVASEPKPAKAGSLDQSSSDWQRAIAEHRP